MGAGQDLGGLCPPCPQRRTATVHAACGGLEPLLAFLPFACSTKLSTSTVIQAKKTLDKFESVSGLHITAVRQLILVFVAFYALILDLFAPPAQMLNFTPYWRGGGGESIGGPGPTRGTGNSNTGGLSQQVNSVQLSNEFV